MPPKNKPYSKKQGLRSVNVNLTTGTIKKRKGRKRKLDLNIDGFGLSAVYDKGVYNFNPQEGVHSSTSIRNKGLDLTVPVGDTSLTLGGSRISQEYQTDVNVPGQSVTYSGKAKPQYQYRGGFQTPLLGGTLSGNLSVNPSQESIGKKRKIRGRLGWGINFNKGGKVK